MFCPQCKGEYRPRFTRCSDCDVELVDQLPAELDQPPIPFPPEAQSKRVCFSDNQESCVYVCSRLRAAGTPFKVARDKQNRRWRPEDATVEVWSEKVEERAWFEHGKGLASMIELSLRANGIGAYIDVSRRKRA